MDKYILSYLAGAIDSDGHISLKKSSQRKRIRGDMVSDSYFGLIGLKQVTDDIPSLLKGVFGGAHFLTKQQTNNSKQLWSWQVTCEQSYRACEALLPYLRVKKKQALILLELSSTRDKKYRSALYWYELKYPSWPETEELITTNEANAIIGYTHHSGIYQAIHKGLVPCLPTDHNSHTQKARIPRSFCEIYKNLKPNQLPYDLIKWRERLWLECKELNKIGINGTPIYHKTGPYTRA